MASTFFFSSFFFFVKYGSCGKCTLTFISSMHSMHSNLFFLLFLLLLLFIFPRHSGIFFSMYIYIHKHIKCAHMNHVYISDYSADSYLRLQ